MKPVIVCVDDESLILDSLKMLLKENFGAGYSIETAESGKEALDLIDELIRDGEEIPILISDYVMPGIKGDELLILAHSKIPDTLKIMLTGQADLRGVENVINRANLYRFLSKPWTTNDFVLTVGEALKSFGQTKQIRVQNKEIERSEKRYKDLVENSIDVIFSLSHDERIRTINQSVSKVLRYNPKNLIGKKFTDLVYKTDPINEKIFQERFFELIHSKNNVSFNASLITAAGEPKEMQIRMQYIQIENEFLIYGTASNIEENILLRLCETESQVYKIENYMTQIDLIGRRISEAILKYSNPDNVFLMKLCLMELLVNAMEHGNLGISFHEKSTSLESGEYYELLYARQNSSEHKNKRIIVDYALSPTKVEIRITDEGDGFDHKKHISDLETNGISNKLSHGRGLQLARGFFNILEYNEKGNSIFLVKDFR